MKRAQGGIITTVLIVLIVIVAVIIVWNVVRTAISEKSGELHTEKFNVGLSSYTVNLIQDPIKISVERSTGQGIISAIKIVFKDASGVTWTYTNTTSLPGELEQVTYLIAQSLFPAGFKPVSFEIYPVLNIDGKEEIGLKADIIINRSIEINNTTPIPQQIDCFGDNDRDGYYNGTSITVSGSNCPSGWNSTRLSTAIDCNDNNATIWQNLQGYVDADKDNYGTGNLQTVCSGSALPIGYSTNNLDCNDSNMAINPGAIDNPSNEIDENCDGKLLIDSCSNLGINNGIYLLSGPVSATGFNCFVINGNNITLDCVNFSNKIAYGVSSNSIGIRIYGNYTIVQNCHVEHKGVYSSFINEYVGILFSSKSSYDIIRDVNVKNSSTGIWLGESDNTLIRVNVSQNYIGIYAQGNFVNVIQDSIGCNNFGYGFYCFDSLSDNVTRISGSNNKFANVKQCQKLPVWPVSGVHYTAC